MARWNRFKEGFTPPPRQTAYRLTTQQREELESALPIDYIPPKLLRCIEDGVHGYRGSRQADADTDKTLSAFERRMAAASKLAAQLCDVLGDRDSELQAVLRERRNNWNDFLALIPKRGHGNSEDREFMWLAYRVVAQLDECGVELETGRNKRVIVVLWLLKRWIRDAQQGRARKNHSADSRCPGSQYEIFKAIVDGFNESKAARSAKSRGIPSLAERRRPT